MIGLSVADPNIRFFISKLLQDGQPFPFSDQNPWLLHESGSFFGLGVNLNLGSQNLIAAQKLFHKRLNHDGRVGRNHHFPLALIEHLEALPPHVGGVESRKDRPGGQLDVPDFEPREGDVDERLDR